MVTPERYNAVAGAAFRGCSESLRYLIEAGADVNIIDITGLSALMRAVRYGHFKCVELLVKAGANVNTVNPMGVSVLQQVVWQPHSSCKDVMEKMGAKYIPEDHSHQKCMEILLRTGVGTKAHRQNVIDAFMSAIEYNYHDLYEGFDPSRS